MIPAANGADSGDERERRRRARRPTMWTSTPEARRPGGDRGHEHVARAARVLADDDRPAVPDQSVGDGPAEGVGRRRLEVDVGDAADPVRAEQASHRSVSLPTAMATASAGAGDARPARGP